MTSDRQLVTRREGGGVYTFERDGKFFVQVEECAAFDLLDEADREGVEPGRSLCFPDPLSRYAYMVDRGWVTPATDEVPGLVQALYALTRRLEELFPGRHFTPDGHLVGSIGEVLAAHRYDLTLLTAGHPHHDASCKRTGRLVEVKATQGGRIALRGEPAHLLVLKIAPDGTAHEVYNGPGALPWAQAGRMQSNGQRAISLPRLRRLMADVAAHDRLPRIRD